MKEKELKVFLLKNKIKIEGEIKCNQKIYKDIFHSIEKYSLPYKRVFQKFKYTNNKITAFDNEKNEENCLISFIFILNAISMDIKLEKSHLLQFVIMIFNKICSKRKLKLSIIEIIGKFLFELNDYENLIYHFCLCDNKDKVFDIVYNIPITYENKIRIKQYIKAQEQPSKIFKEFLSFSNNNEKPIEFLAKVYKWEFNMNLFYLLSRKDTLTYTDVDFIQIKNNIKLLQKIISEEDKDHKTKEKKKKIMNGILIKYCFNTNNVFDFEGKNEYYIKFTFKYFKDNNLNKTFTLLTLFSENGYNATLSLEVKNDILLVLNEEDKEEITELTPNVVYDLYFITISWNLAFIQKSETKIIVNDYKKNLSKPYILKEKYFLKIGPFFGEIGEITINSGKINEEPDNVRPIIKICPLLMYENFIINPNAKEFNVISRTKNNILFCKENGSFDRFIYDIPFYKKRSRFEFDNCFGYEYLSYLMNIIYYKANKDNVVEVYECLDELFSFLLLMIQNRTNISKVITLFYSLSILCEKICNYQKLSEPLVVLLLNFIIEAESLNYPTSFINKIFMILMNSKNTTIESFNKYILESYKDNIELIKDDIIKTKPYNLFYLNAIIYFFKNIYDNKILPKLFAFLLEKSKSQLIAEFIYKIQLISIDPVNNNESNREINLKISYKLLKMLYLSISKVGHNFSQNSKILHNFLQILKLKSNDKYANYLKFLTIRYIDDFFITKYNSNINISFSTIRINEDTSNNLTEWRKCLDKLIENIDDSITPEILKSFLLISFNTINSRNNIKFCKIGLSPIKSSQITNTSTKLVKFEDLISNNEQISIVFSIINKIYSNQNLIDFYKSFLKKFYDDILLKIKCKNTNCFKIFQNQKIFGDIYYNIIRLNEENKKILLFPYEQICSQMEEIIKLQSEPFYFKLIERLNTQVINNYNNSTIANLENSITYKYFIHLMETLCKVLTFDIGKGNFNIVINTKNFFLLFATIIYKMSIEISPSSDEGEKLISKVISLFKSYIKTNYDNPLLYTKTHFKQRTIIETIYDVFIDEIKRNEIMIQNERENGNDNIKEIIEILMKIIFPKWMDTKNGNKTIFIELDMQKQKIYPILKEAGKLDRKFANEKEGTINTCLFSLVFLRKFLLHKSFANIQLNCFIEHIQKCLISDINKYYIKKLLDKYISESKSKSYNYFKGRIEKELLAKNSEGKELTLEFLKEVVNEINNQEAKSNTNVNQMNTESINNNNNNNLNSGKFAKVNNQEIKNDQLSSNALNEYEILNNIDNWFDEIGDYGILSVYKSKSFFFKKLFANFAIDEYYEDNNFSTVIQKFDKYFIEEDTSRKFYYLKYPCKIKNYITDNFTKPFLKLNRCFYTDDKFLISHQYFKSKTNEKQVNEDKLSHQTDKTNTIKNKDIIKMHFDKSNKFEAELIILAGAIYVDVYITSNCLIIQASSIKDTDRRNKYLFSSIDYISKSKNIIIFFNEIKEILVRRFVYYWQALEIFLKNNKAYYLNFFTSEKKENFLTQIKRAKTKFPFYIIENSKLEFLSNKYIQQWESHSLSTFNLLNYLNKYSSRSFNDLNQYPIFPWLFANYSSKSIMEKITNLRMFNYPISLQSEEKINKFKKSIMEARELENKQLNESNDKFEALQEEPHLNIHYSICAFVYFYLVRLSPITECHIEFQSGQFDFPSRIFTDISCMGNILQKFNDNRELIPEFFYLSELYYNMNLCSFGIKQDKIINNVYLPEGFDNSTEFIYFNRNQLENNERINRDISKWIDNVFGIGQFPNNRNEISCNVFQWQSYEEKMRERFEICLKEGKKTDIICDKTFAINFGQCPSKLLNSPMKSRKSKITVDSLLRADDMNQKLLSNIGKAKETYSYIKKEKTHFISMEDDISILMVLYAKSNNIFVITSKNIMLIYSKKDYQLKNTIPLGEYYTYITEQCIFECGNEVKKERLLFENKKKNPLTLVCGNFTDRTIKIFTSLDAHNNKSFNAKNVISVLCQINSNAFYTGSTNGILTKWQISFQNNQLTIEQISPNILCHKNNKMITSIKFIDEYNCIVTTGNDNYLYIRNAYNYELITAIHLMAFNYNVQRDLYISLYNIIYLYDNTNNTVNVYTVNGMKVCDEKSGINSTRVIMLDGGNRMIYVDTEKYKMYEVAPLNIGKIINEWDVNFGDKMIKIERVFYDSENRCFDFWNSDGSIRRLFLKKDKIKKEKQKIRKESDEMKITKINDEKEEEKKENDEKENKHKIFSLIENIFS